MKIERAPWMVFTIRIVLMLLGCLFLGYLVVKAHRGGNDINVYLHAAGQLLDGQNIYVQNPFNFYLYSPLFALLLSPLSLLNMPVARIVWMLFNLAIAIRLWFLLKAMLPPLSPGRSQIWTFFVIVLSLGFLNHNFVLGQVTILILWLTIEGICLVERGKSVPGALLIALGINFKIIPLLVLVYFGMKGRFKAIILSVTFLIMSFILPGVFIGFTYNAQLHSAWKDVINPAGERFIFEDLDGCHSLNAVLPAYFYDFSKDVRIVKPYVRNVHYPRMIMAFPHDVLATILQVLRLLVLGVFFSAVLPRSWLQGTLHGLPRRFNNRVVAEFTTRKQVSASPDVYLFRDIAFLCLVTLLIFPHQMKYSMLYFVPAGAYVLYYFLKKRATMGGWNRPDVLTGVLAAVLMLVLAVMGRDIIGDYLVDVLDYYHFMGLSNLIFLGILWYCHPDKLHISGETHPPAPFSSPENG